MRDLHGNVVRFVKVSPGEKTCCTCGETVAAESSFCIRCSDTDNGYYCRELVPTVDYLRPEEYVTT